MNTGNTEKQSISGIHLHPQSRGLQPEVHTAGIKIAQKISSELVTNIFRVYIILKDIVNKSEKFQLNQI